ncbi:MAG: winged helix-turn-helix transcriptional regulator [Nitrososphaeria archaeon]
MDKTDIILCQLLLSNSRLSYRELANKLNLSVTAVHSRIQSLVEQGIIRRFSARVNIMILDAVSVLIFGLSKAESVHELSEKFANHGSIYWFAIGGGNFIYIGAYLRNINELEGFVSYVKETARLDTPTVGITSTPFPSNTPRPMAKLSDIDYRIINALKDNSRKSTLEVAEEIGVSAKTVRRRLNRMINLGLIELSIDWYPDVSNDIITILHINLKPDTDKNIVRRVLQKYSPNIIMHFTFSNIPDFILAILWTNTMREVEKVRVSLENERIFTSILPNILYTGYVYKTWVDRFTEK